MLVYPTNNIGEAYKLYKRTLKGYIPFLYHTIMSSFIMSLSSIHIKLYFATEYMLYIQI